MADPAPVTPQRPAEVTLRGGDLPWRPVSPMLTRVRLITAAAVVLPLLLVTLVVGLFVTRWVLLGTLAVVLVGLWAAWLIGRQVSAISWVELDEEIVIRKGRMFRSLVSVPYGRLQYVDIQSGRSRGRTASPRARSTPPRRRAVARCPGCPVAEAEALRSRLAARGEAQRAGL